MVEQFISKQRLIELIEKKLEENGQGYPLEEMLQEIKGVQPANVVPQFMYRISEFDLRNALNELKQFEEHGDITRCSNCKYVTVKDERFWCSRFTLKTQEETRVPNNGYCAWGKRNGN